MYCKHHPCAWTMPCIRQCSPGANHWMLLKGGEGVVLVRRALPIHLLHSPGRGTLPQVLLCSFVTGQTGLYAVCTGWQDLPACM
jgi:hypothetical protein